MISGCQQRSRRNPEAKRRRSDAARLAATLAGILALSASGVRAEPNRPTLEALLAGFRGMPGLEARFHEEKTIALLAAPLISEGTLHFAPPARLARHTLRPERSTLLIDGSRLTFGDARSHETIDLEIHPEVRAYVNSFLQILAGDREGLTRNWLADLTGGKDGWRIRLQPLADPIRSTIRLMEIEGRGVVIDKFRIVETTGDETLTVFTAVDPDRRYTEAEARRIFRIPPDGG